MVAAPVVDLLLVAIPTLIAIWTLHERFPFVPGSDPAVFAPADQVRVNQLDQGFARAFETDSALYALSGSSWWLSVGLLVVLTVVVYGVVPATAGFRTPGMLLLRLRAPRTSKTQVELLHDLTDTAADEPAEPEADADDTPEDPDQHPAEDDDPEAGQHTQDDATAEARNSNDDQDAVDSDRRGPGDGLDSTEQRWIRPVTLADDDDYRRWDQEFGSARPAEPPVVAVARPGFEALALPESSLSDAPLTTATLTKARARLEEPAAGTESTAPVWNEDWNAWLYWDGERRRWFRHDKASGRWSPLL